MFVGHFSVFFVLCVILINTDIVYSKRGCASFGHTCFGGHGKRSQQPEAQDQPLLESSQELINQQYPVKTDSLPDEQYPNMFDNFEKPKTDLKTLLQNLAKLYNEDQQMHQKYINKYFNK